MIKKTLPAKELQKSKRMVRRILAHHLGADHFDGKPARIEHQAGGLTNLVFTVHNKDADYVVRMSPNPQQLNSYLKEQWAMAKARDAGVPAPEVLQVGNEAVPYPYMILRQCRGREATFHPERNRIVRQMGRYAAVINSIRTTGFGSTFEWSRNQLSHNATWSEFLKNELKMDERLLILEGNGMLETARIKKLRTTLEGAAGKDRAPALNHGDLRLKNVLADDEGSISCILDWEHSASNLAPEWEMSIALHDLTTDEKQEFIDGYGLSAEQVSDIAAPVKAINLINYAPLVEQASKSRSSSRLERYRLRLSAKLDLYCL